MDKEVLDFGRMSAADVLRSLGARRDGLREDEVRLMRAQYGRNVLPRPRRPGAIVLFVRQFGGALMAVLLLALAVSIALGDRAESLLIGIIVVLHAVLGFVQEYRADRAFERLSAYLPRTARVRRDGRVCTVSAEDVVVGDVLVLAAGASVVADARVLTATACEVNEASLTGESVPVAKRTEDGVVYAGTTIAAGTADAVVYAVGGRTEFGAIVRQTAGAGETSTPLQTQLGRFSRSLLLIILTVIAVVVAWGVEKGIALWEMLPLALALAVAAVPEGLLVIVTIILAGGMQRMARSKALVRSLLAAETLGSVTVICTDKTGTLTEGRMVVTELRPLDGIPALLEVLRLGNAGDVSATEASLLVYLEEKGVQMPHDARLLGALPFDSRNKFSAFAYATPQGHRLVAVGAADVLLDRCDVTDGERGRLASEIDVLSRRGLRVLLAVERRDDVPAQPAAADVHDMHAVGVVGLEDPVRPEVAGMVAEAAQAGIRTIMVTGDHPGTARAVATAVGLPAYPPVTGVELTHLSDAALRARIDEMSVFARIRPEDKLRIVRALQANGATVAMTGDGVNDAPALRAADIGIAVGSGTDVAKEAADLVLLDNNFRTVITAIREGRGVFDNIRKVIAYLMTGSFTEVVLVLAALVGSTVLPLLPLHILWINVLSDGITALALSAEPPEPETMRDAPRSRFEPLLRRELVWLIGIAAIVMDGVLVALLLLLSRSGMEPDLLRSIVFLTLGFSSVFYIVAMRSFRRSGFMTSPATNPWLYVAILVSSALIIVPFLVPVLREAMHLVPAALQAAPYLAGLAVVKILLIEALKFVFVPRR